MATPPDFVSGQILTAAQMNAVGMWLVKSQTIGSAVASVSVTDAFTADFENYYISVIGGVGSTAQFIGMSLTGSAVSYYQSGTDISYGTGTVLGFNNSNTSSWSVVGYSSTSNNSLMVNLFAPNLAKSTGINGSIAPHQTGSGSRTFGGFHNVSTAYTGFTLTVGGTMTGGTIKVYGYND